MKLDEIESYLVKDAKSRDNPAVSDYLQLWVRARFSELRAREEAKENAEAVAEAEYFEREQDETARQAYEEAEADERAREARGDA